MKTLRIALILLLVEALLALTACSTHDGEVTDNSLMATAPTVTVPSFTVPAATLTPTTPADNGILSTEPPVAEATATAVPVQ